MKKIPPIIFIIASTGVFLPGWGPMLLMGIGFMTLIMYANVKKFGMMMDGDLFKNPEKKLKQSEVEEIVMKSCIALALGGVFAVTLKIIYWSM